MRRVFPGKYRAPSQLLILLFLLLLSIASGITASTILVVRPVARSTTATKSFLSNVSLSSISATSADAGAGTYMYEYCSKLNNVIASQYV